MLPLKESGAVRTGMAAGARYRAPTWLLVTAMSTEGSPSLSLMACWTCSLPGRVSTVVTYSLRRKTSSTGIGLGVVLAEPDGEHLLGVVLAPDQLAAAGVAPALDGRAVVDQADSGQTQNDGRW